MICNAVHNTLDGVLAHLVTITLEFFGYEMAVGHLAVLAHEAGVARIIGSVEVVSVAGFTSNGFAILTGQGEGISFRSLSLGQYADSSNDEGFIHVGQPLRRRFA